MVTEERLSDVLSEFARTLVTDFPIQQILDHLVRRIVDLLPIGAAGVSLITATSQPELFAGSDESAIRYEHLQTSLGEGPCLAAFETDAPIAIPDLRADDRFPRFAEQARLEGLAAVFTFPLRNDGRRLGALDLYRTTPGGLDEREMVVAQTLADVTTAYLLNARARQAKTEFVAMVSHELRTPMTSITGYLEMLEDGEGGPLTPEQEEYVHAMRRNSARLLGLANDLLMLSSLEANTPEHAQVDIDLGQVVRATVSSLERAATARHLDVSFSIDDAPTHVLGDLGSLQSVVSNLVGNAVKFTQDGGWVRCTLHPAAGMAVLVVSDNGLGIPSAEQPDLFTRFFRSSTAHEHAIQGSGLGLTIVDSIVRGYGGQISVVSEHLSGSTFTVTLPLLETA